MTDIISSIWSDEPPAALDRRLHQLLGVNTNGKPTIRVFFRADDIGRVDPQFNRLMRLFKKHQAPLCLAVVPEWLDHARWREMLPYTPDDPLWCWHQHGRRHTNYEPTGKKSEFGVSRSKEQIRSDLQQGRDRLQNIFGRLFVPVFTPPWNRCSTETLEILCELDFKAISRFRGAQPRSPLPDLAINVDLHTRREKNARQGWDRLLSEFKEAAQSGCMGIMIHHQRMNDAAFDFLDLLLPILKGHQSVSCRSFRDFTEKP